MVAASSVVVLLVESLLCEWRVFQPRSQVAAFMMATIYILIAVVSGLAFIRLFWFRARIESSASSLALFVILNAIGWVWVPTVVLLSRESSMIAVLVAMIAAMAMASGLRKVMPPVVNGEPTLPHNGNCESRELFSAFLETHPWQWEGWIIAAGCYGTLFAVQRHWLAVASFLGALSVFPLTWQLTGGVEVVPNAKLDRASGGSRLAKAASIAIVVTAELLISGFQRKTSPQGVNPSIIASKASATQGVRQHKTVAPSDPGLMGYQRIILWPSTEKKNIAAPRLFTGPSRGFDVSKPLVIRFDGSYWYFHLRDESRGTKTHIERGSPLTAGVRSASYIPLVMEAHQLLATAIPLKCCREIRVTIENFDNKPGVISLGVLLADSNPPGKPTLYLDQQTIASTEPGEFAVKPAPVSEVLTFKVPTAPKIQRFDTITVIFFPDTERPNKGANIAIQQFELVPR